MIAFIRGIVHSCSRDTVLIDHQGIGYRIYVANPQAFVLQSETTVYTYQHIREDAITLFGFASMEEHDLFLRLISVKGVGPKTALGMLAVCPAQNMISAIEHNDVKTLKGLPGIGAKTASQIVLDLKGKLVEDTAEEAAGGSKELEEAMEALQALGYKSGELSSVRRQLAQQEGKSSDQYIRLALAALAKKKGV